MSDQFGKQLKLGLIGLGKFGGAVGRRLLASGYPLVTFDLNPDAVQALVSRGAEPARSPSDVAAKADIVLLCLPSLEAGEQAILGAEGVIHGERMQICIDVSTTGAEFARAMSSELERRGKSMLDAPVTGGIRRAEEGSLAVIVSGPQEALERARPVLSCMGQVFHVGQKSGQAQTMKLINNLISTTATAITCEGFVLGVKAGLDPEVMLEVINNGTGRNNATLNKFGPSVLTRAFNYGASMSVPYKDVSLCMKEADKLGVTMWIGNAVRQLYAYAVHRGGPDKDSTSLITHIEEWAGVTVAGKSARAAARKSADV